MPIMRCQSDGKPGWKYGDSGHCYTYEQGNKDSEARARMQAERQARAIEANRHRDG